MLSEAKIRSHFEDAVEQTGLTVEEILAEYSLTIKDLITINDQTGLDIEDILDLHRVF